MTQKELSHTESGTTPNQKLGPNERAILDTIKIPAVRNLATTIVQIKMRLQFTGWLQYMLPLAPTLMIFIIAVIALLLGLSLVAQLFAFAGTLLLAISIFDLITVKFRLRFPEPLPKRNDNLGIFDLMRARCSCRSFQTRKLKPEDYNELMEYLRLHCESPTIGKAPIRFEYISAPLTVWPTVNATEFLVAIAPSKYDRLAVIDIGRTLQKIVIDATRMGLGTCWIGPGADQSSIIRHLGQRFNPNEDHIICICAIGYKSGYIPLFIRLFNRQFHQRLPLSTLFFADSSFKEALNVEASPFNRFGRNYEVCQWSPSSYNGQTTRCVAVMEQNAANEPHLTRFDFYAVTESRYYAAVALGIWCADWEMGSETLDIHGHFAVLSDLERGIFEQANRPQLPKYDVSWVLDENI